MCESCETALRALDATLGTLVVARETIVRRMEEEAREATTVKEDTPGCRHDQSEPFQTRDGIMCPDCMEVIG